MKIIDYIFLSIAVVFLIIGIDQILRGSTSLSVAQRVSDNYWIFMVSALSLLALNYRKFNKKKDKTK